MYRVDLALIWNGKKTMPFLRQTKGAQFTLHISRMLFLVIRVVCQPREALFSVSKRRSNSAKDSHEASLESVSSIEVYHYVAAPEPVLDQFSRGIWPDSMHIWVGDVDIVTALSLSASCDSHVGWCKKVRLNQYWPFQRRKSLSIQTKPNHTIIYHTVYIFFKRLKGCASVLNTHSSRLIKSSSENISHRYLSVSASQKLSMESRCVSSSLVISSTAENAASVSVALRIEVHIFHAISLRSSLPVMR